MNPSANRFRPGMESLEARENPSTLLYESFEGHPLRKDYPVSRRQPLIGPAI